MAYLLNTDVCIIGSGAGGSAAAYALSMKGLRVVILERGSNLKPSDFSQREEKMFPKLFYDCGGRRTKDRAIRVLHGHGVGGSTLHNINLCKRLPDEIFSQWNLSKFTKATLEPHFQKIEKLLHVTHIPPEKLNANNRILKDGVEKLGWRGGLLSHNRVGCMESGFCELGCAFNAKMNAARVLIPEALKSGTQVYANTHAIQFEYSRHKIKQVVANVYDTENKKIQHTLTVHAKAFVCAGGAIETPLLLQRSRVPDPYRFIGSKLHLHPGRAVLGIFDKKIEAWKGIPQSYECTEFSTQPNRIWIIAGSAHPIGAASLLPGFGEEHARLMKKLPNIACITVMVHDKTQGSVYGKGQTGATIDYTLNESDQAQLKLGIQKASQILIEAGASEIITPEDQTISVHPMSTVWMGEDPRTSCISSECKFHQLDNLFVADTSVYPTSIGVPPQITTYAVGLHAAEMIYQSLSTLKI